MTAALRLAPNFLRLRLLRPLCHAMTASVAANPDSCCFRPKLQESDHRASYVHLVIRVTSDRRPPLYARKTQSQCPRHQPVAYTPIARAVQLDHRAFSSAASTRPITRCLTPSPSFSSVLKVWTLQTRVSFVALVRLRLGVWRA